MNYLLLIIGFILLIKGADYFVEGSASVAKRFHIPTLIIGMTIVAMGTSAPEAAVSITASIQGNNDIALGNVVGSNIFNLLMVVGVCAMIKPMRVNQSALVLEFPLSIIAAVVMLILGADVLLNSQSGNLLGRADGLILLIFMGIFLFLQISQGIMAMNEPLDMELAEEVKVITPWKSVLFILGGLAGVVIGGKLVVDSASSTAASFGVSENLIALTIVAIGTSLPELVTSIVAARKGESDLALGNVIGSNIFNIFFIMGLTAAISNVPVNPLSLTDLIILIGISLLTYVFAWTKKTVGRAEGAVMVLLYLGFTGYILIR